MAWETRHDGRHSYYYLKRRECGRVRSVYVGAGEDVSDFVELVEARRAQKLGARAAGHRPRRDDPDASLLEAVKIAETLARAALLAFGFHTHKGQWRRSRNG